MKRFVYTVEFLLKLVFCLFTVYAATININAIPTLIVIGVIVWEFVLKDSLHSIAGVEDAGIKRKVLNLEKEIKELRQKIESQSKE